MSAAGLQSQSGTTKFFVNLSAPPDGSSPITGAAMLESIFRAAPVGICVVTGGVFTHVNSRLCEMTGYARRELIGQPETFLCASAASLTRNQLHSQESQAVETRWQCKDADGLMCCSASAGSTCPVRRQA